MEVGHPVTTENGSHGIITQKHKDGITCAIPVFGGASVFVDYPSALIKAEIRESVSNDADVATLINHAQAAIKADENEKHNLATLKDLFARRAAIDAAIVALKKVMYWDDEQ